MAQISNYIHIKSGCQVKSSILLIELKAIGPYKRNNTNNHNIILNTYSIKTKHKFNLTVWKHEEMTHTYICWDAGRFYDSLNLILDMYIFTVML